MNLQQLELNVNMHALQPGFLNQELHYVIASDEHNFRFAELEDAAGTGEQKYYAFLTDRELKIPAGDVTIRKSYSIQTDPIYPLLNKGQDFYPFVDCIGANCTGKAVRNFDDSSVDEIMQDLRLKYGSAEKHLIKSPEFQHLLIVLPLAEISISATMVYFKQRSPFTNEHYEHLKQEKQATH